MATTGNKRETELQINVSTSGTDAVKTLRSEVAALGKEGGDAAPEFQRLGSELDKIAGKQNAIDSFATLKRETVDLGVAMTSAAAEVDRLGAQLPEVSANTRTFVQAQNEAKVALDAEKKLLEEAKVALDNLKGANIGAARDTDTYRIAAGELKETISQLKKNVADANAEFRSASTAAKEAASAEKTLTAEFNASLNTARELSGELSRRNGVLESSRAVLAANGVETTKLNEAQQGLRQSFNDIAAALDKEVSSLARAKTFTEQLAQAERLLQSELEIESASRLEAIARENEAEQRRAQVAQQSADKIIAAAKESGAALDAAFASTGVRSAQAIQAEMTQINESLVRLATNARVSGADFDRAFASSQTRIASLQAELKGLPATVDSTSASVGYLRQQFSQLAAIYGGIQLGQAFLDANVQIETLRRTLTFVTGSSAEAANQIKLLQEVANRTGVAVSGIADAFIRFQASARQAGIASSVVQDLFVGITAAAGKMGLSTDRVALSLEAVSQIAGKGVVSMEELRGQLGDSLPGAMNIAARSVGLTVSQFTKLVETGQVLSEDFLPAFAAEFKKTFGDGGTQIEGFSQSFNRLKNALTAVSQQAADSTAFKALAATMDFLAKNMQTVVDGAYSIGKAFVALKAIQIVGEFTGITAALQANAIAQQRNAVAIAERTVAQEASNVVQAASTVRTATNTVALEANALAAKANALAWGTLETNLARSAVASTASAASTTALGVAAAAGRSAISGLSAIVGGLPGLLVATVVSGKEVGTWIGESIAKWTGYGKVLEENEAKMKAFDEAAKKNAESAAKLPDSWLKVASAYLQSNAAAEKNVQTLTKLADAAKTNAETSTRLAQLSGNESEARAVAATAALNLVGAYEKVQSAQRMQLDLLTQERAALVASAGGEDKLTQAKRDALKIIDQKIEKAKAETEQSIAATQAAKEEATGKTLLVQVNLDNSKSVGVLKQAYDDALGTFKLVQQAFKEGIATQAQLDAANVKSVAAERLYIDSLQDVVKAIQLKTEVAKADSTLAVSVTNLSRAQIQAQIDVAKATKDERLERELSVQQKYLEIKAIDQSVAAMKIEAQGTIDSTNAQIEALKASGDLTAAKKIELEIVIKSAQARLNDAAALQAGADPLRAQIALLQQYATAAANASSSLDKFNASVQSKLGTNKYDASGNALDSSGNLLQISGQVNVPAGYVFDQAAFNRATQVAIDTHGKYPDPAKYYKPPSGSSEKPGTLTGPVATPSGLVSNGASGYSPLNANAQAAQAAQAAAAVLQSTPSSVSSSHTVEIKLQGTAFEKYQSTLVNLSTQYDAASLVNFLKQLDNSARSAGGVL